MPRRTTFHPTVPDRQRGRMTDPLKRRGPDPVSYQTGTATPTGREGEFNWSYTTDPNRRLEDPRWRGRFSDRNAELFSGPRSIQRKTSTSGLGAQGSTWLDRPEARVLEGLTQLWQTKYGHASPAQFLTAIGVNPTAPGSGNPASWLGPMLEEEMGYWGSPEEAIQGLLGRADAALQMFGPEAPPPPSPEPDAGSGEPQGSGRFYMGNEIPVQDTTNPTDWWSWLFGGGMGGLGAVGGDTATAAPPPLAINPQYFRFR